MLTSSSSAAPQSSPSPQFSLSSQPLSEEAGGSGWAGGQVGGRGLSEVGERELEVLQQQRGLCGLLAGGLNLNNAPAIQKQPQFEEAVAGGLGKGESASDLVPVAPEHVVVVLRVQGLSLI